MWVALFKDPWRRGCSAYGQRLNRSLASRPESFREKLLNSTNFNCLRCSSIRFCLSTASARTLLASDIRIAASTLSMILVHSSVGTFLFEIQKSFPLPRSQKFIVPLFHDVDMGSQVQLPLQDALLHAGAKKKRANRRTMEEGLRQSYKEFVRRG